MLNPCFEVYFSSFWHDPKGPKDLGLIKICCVSMPEVSARNTRHERFEQIQPFGLAVYCYSHACAHTSVKNR